jgi:hypothetical protein
LIESCAEFEYQYFIKQNDQTQYIKSAYQWLHSLYQTQGEQSFENIYYHGLVHLVSDDEETVRALSLKAHNFPMTLKFDQRRMTHQFRYEFQNMIVISILIIPYRHLIGKEDHVDNLTKLKQVYNTLLKKKNSCHHLALHACEAAQKPETVAFWEEWLSHNLQSNSSIFRLMYERICQQLVFYTRHNKLDDHVPFTGLEDEIVMLGSKLKAIAKLNLDVFGNLYKNVAKEILNDSS